MLLFVLHFNPLATQTSFMILGQTNIVPVSRLLPLCSFCKCNFPWLSFSCQNLFWPPCIVLSFSHLLSIISLYCLAIFVFWNNLVHLVVYLFTVYLTLVKISSVGIGTLLTLLTAVFALLSQCLTTEMSEILKIMNYSLILEMLSFLKSWKTLDLQFFLPSHWL